MGRGRGKGKKHAARDDPANGEEERQPGYKRRGRPQKPMKDEIDDDEESAKTEDENETVKSSITGKETEDQAAALDNGRKRKIPSQVKENSDTTKKEEINVSKSKPSADHSIKSVGFRQIGNRRKSKPHRAAEVGVGYK